MEVEIINPGGFAGEDSQEVQAVYAEIATLLMERKTIMEVARIMGMHHQNVRDIKTREGYKRVAREIYAGVVADARAHLLGLMAEATEAIAQVLEDPSTKGAPARLAAAFGVLDRAQHIMPADDGKEIRRILTRVPRPEALPTAPSDENGEPMPLEAGDTPAPPSQAPQAAPEAWGLPAAARRSVITRRIEERKGGMYRIDGGVSE